MPRQPSPNCGSGPARRESAASGERLRSPSRRSAVAAVAKSRCLMSGLACAFVITRGQCTSPAAAADSERYAGRKWYLSSRVCPLLEMDVEVAQQVGPIALDGEQVVRASADEEVSGEQGIGAEGFAGEVESGWPTRPWPCSRACRTGWRRWRWRARWAGDGAAPGGGGGSSMSAKNSGRARIAPPVETWFAARRS